MSNDLLPRSPFKSISTKLDSQVAKSAIILWGTMYAAQVCVNRPGRKNTCAYIYIYLGMSKQKTLDYRVRSFDRFQSHLMNNAPSHPPAQSWYPVTENERTLFSLVMQTQGTVDWAAHHSHHNLHLLIAPWFMDIKTLSSLYYKSPAELMTRGWRRAQSINNLPVVKKKFLDRSF